ncbi:type VI secretion system lipoprotein TssJ [Aromatoleum petrolei]|uniref:Type VI secretion system lipoprotein TssJ n=1 Tax=Aromatoleum petrolei TaxID=76116 RepID=A0ABX1MNG4_9RHOO|nr:type VI secretion system lipoprotein TssJ [Aromatoleum petrolei]NMF87885.1 type VI secretion system lipoprotein TssJ [Aromatoleum petrolei]
MAAGCSTVSALQLAGTVAGVALEAAGLKKADERPAAEAAHPLAMTLATGPATNATRKGDALALVVRIYQLRSNTAFARLTYAQASTPEAERDMLQDDLVTVRELTLLPGKVYRFEEQVPEHVKVIGVTAQFHRPAANRWKLAFDREASQETGIAVAFHACAMTTGTGELAQPATAASARSLSGVRCT